MVRLLYKTKNLIISCSTNLVSSALEMMVPFPPSTALASTPQLDQLLFADMSVMRDRDRGRRMGDGEGLRQTVKIVIGDWVTLKC